MPTPACPAPNWFVNPAEILNAQGRQALTFRSTVPSERAPYLFVMSTLQQILGAGAVLMALSCASPSKLPSNAPTSGASKPSPSSRGPASTGNVPVRLATWNVANLFDTVDDPIDDTVLSPAAFQKKTGQVAAVLETLDCDFVALEEVEDLQCLTAVNDRLLHPYPQLGLIEGNDQDRGIDVAFLSRLPVSAVISHRHDDLPDEPGISRHYKFSRDCLEVVLDTQPPVTVLVNHFKSQLGSKKDAAAKRHAQSGGVVRIAGEIATRRPQGLELVMGDLNDRPGSWSLQPLTEPFVDVFEGIPESSRASHRSKHGRTALDHILISPDGLARVDKARVYQDLGKPTSDHDPVAVTIRLDTKPTRPVARVYSTG